MSADLHRPGRDLCRAVSTVFGPERTQIVFYLVFRFVLILRMDPIFPFFAAQAEGENLGQN